MVFSYFSNNLKISQIYVTLKQHSRYSLLDFREELIRNIMGFEEYAEPPTFRVHKPVGNFTSVHLPQFSASKRHCKVCYRKDKKELKICSYCSAPQCDVFLHCTKDKNCFAEWHKGEYHRKMKK